MFCVPLTIRHTPLSFEGGYDQVNIGKENNHFWHIFHAFGGVNGGIWLLLKVNTFQIWGIQSVKCDATQAYGRCLSPYNALLQQDKVVQACMVTCMQQQL